MRWGAAIQAMFDKAIKTSKSLCGAKNAVLFACKNYRLKITGDASSDNKFRITVKERLSPFNTNYRGAALAITGFQIEDEVLITIMALCKINCVDQENEARSFTDQFASSLESMLLT